METYSRIGLLLCHGNLQSYWTTAMSWKLTVVLDYWNVTETYSRIGLLQCHGNLLVRNAKLKNKYSFCYEGGISAYFLPLAGLICPPENTLETSGENVENTLETGGEDVPSTNFWCILKITSSSSAMSTSRSSLQLTMPNLLHSFRV
jgi:hypothetical protein